MNPPREKDIRRISIDWNSPSDLKKLNVQVGKRRREILRSLGYDEVCFNGSKYNMASIIPAFEAIYGTDLAGVYGTPSGPRDYYLYFHCDPSKPLTVANNVKHYFLATRFPSLTHEPFYVGKGISGRYLDLTRNEGHRKIRTKILASGAEVIAVKALENLTEAEALAVESKMIDVLGLKTYSPHGLLVNLDEGTKSSERRTVYGDTCKRILVKNGFMVKGGR